MNLETTNTAPVLTFPAEEAKLVAHEYAAAKCILEYGSGGSTWLAAQAENKKIVSVESDKNWADDLLKRITEAQLPTIPKIIHVDIGPVGEWGMPQEFSHWNKFFRYALEPWESTEALEPDLVLIDGRFRTACFAATMLNIRRPTIVLFDDYVSRPNYQKVEDLLKPTKIVGRMARFELVPRVFGPKEFGLLVGLFFNTPTMKASDSGYLRKKLVELELENQITAKKLKRLQTEVPRLRAKVRNMSLRRSWQLFWIFGASIFGVLTAPVSMPIAFYLYRRNKTRRPKT